MRENREYYIPCDGIRLHAKLDFPQAGGDRFPLAIVVHGLTGDMEEPHLRGLSRALNEHGCATLRVELYGHGKSEGEFRDHTLLIWVMELLRVIDHAKQLDFVTDLYMTGHSQGGAATVLAAGIRGDDLKAIMPLAPAFNLKDAAISGNMPNSPFDPEHVPDEYLLFGKYPISGTFLLVNRLLPFEEAIRAYKKPVLLVHATADEAVPYEYSVAAEKAYENARLVTILDDDHCFSAHLQQMLDAVTAFFDELDA